MLVCLVKYDGNTYLKIYEELYIPLETGKMKTLKEMLIKNRFNLFPLVFFSSRIELSGPLNQIHKI